VTPDWLRESVKEGRPVACGGFAALRELHDATVEHCPESEGKSESQASSSASASPPPPQQKDDAPSFRPTNPRVFSKWRAKYACERASPLVCPNQKLAVELGILNRARDLEGNNMSALSYEKSVAVCALRLVNGACLLTRYLDYKM
jgi:DNA polymerase mu